ncbi:hypothetical protein QVD17_00170 [Tagetes erecta]|uniref:Uncharacterized protein n=1 Tax=Tagetes erecta TaxID=13708 RepID=A0AAD8L2U0_TARER|nr:hypothetical protein QVD17_00170 [Tagetes erecta]
MQPLKGPRFPHVTLSLRVLPLYIIHFSDLICFSNRLSFDLCDIVLIVCLLICVSSNRMILLLIVGVQFSCCQIICYVFTLPAWFCDHR